jgi:undecaprenyl-diphosphatase
VVRGQRTRAFLAARLDSRTFLGLQLTIALIVAVFGIWAFGALLDAVLDNAKLVRWDMHVVEWIHARTTPVGLAFSNVVSSIGSPTTMTGVGVAGAGILLLQGRALTLIAWSAAFLGGGILDPAIKLFVHRTRPMLDAAQMTAHTYSFPSGHALGSFVGFGMIAYLSARVWQAAPAKRAAVLAACTSMIVLVGASRVYLGVHYPSDVLAAWAAAAVWLAVCLSGLGIALHRRGGVSSL